MFHLCNCVSYFANFSKFLTGPFSLKNRKLIFTFQATKLKSRDLISLKKQVEKYLSLTAAY